ncbi:hypothetical protein J6O48_05810 [bacterium]|nr:hypothetical protein [bacterium]MBP3820685.1 hypothetical protein [bacterium]
MVERISPRIFQTNYSTINSVSNNITKTSVTDKTVSRPSFCANSDSIVNNPVNQTTIRTQLTTKDENEKYKTVLSKLDRNSKKVVESLLKNGILLNNNSNDKSSVLDNLYKISTEPRAYGLDATVILKDTIAAIAYPFIITQQFGDIPANYLNEVININNESKSNLIDVQQSAKDVNVEHSGTCVAASTEFKLAKQMPAEFARFAQGLSSEKMSVDKEIVLDNLADNTLNGVWLLNAFNMPYKMDNYDKAILTFAPDKNAIIRAKIQTKNKDSYERTPLDVLMQSTFMQIGSQQSYNTLTDKRGGKFNQNDKGLIEFEKTFTESVVFDKNILSVTYQTVDENARLVGYETDLDTMKNQLLSALDMGENVIIGYTQTNENNIIVNGHEITIIGYKKDNNGKLTFICNDTDDGVSRPLEYPEDYLLPKIHHAALPKEIVEKDLDIVPNWVEGVEIYRQMKNQSRNIA